MSLRDLMRRHARGIVTSELHHGELVTYRRGDTDREVRAVVTRLEREADVPGLSQIAKQRAHLALPRDATVGILNVVAGDTVLLDLHENGEVVECRVRREVRRDHGMITIEVEQ